MEQLCSSLLCLYSCLELKKMITSVILYNSCFYKYDQILSKPLKKYIHNCALQLTPNGERPSCPNWTWMRNKYSEKDLLSGDICKPQSKC